MPTTDIHLPQVRCVTAAGAILGEGPVWVAREQALYWLDIKGCRLHRFKPGPDDATSWETPFRIGAIAPRRQGGFVGASERGFVLIDRDVTRFELIGHPEPELPGNRANDGKLDAAGRFWAGTMDDAEQQRRGSLYRLDADLTWSRRDTDYMVPNGPAFSPDGRYCYHTESSERTIHRFELDAHGVLTGKIPFAQFGGEDGYPDGMTVDGEGCLWVAFWDGWCVRRLSPGGDVIGQVELPVQRPTSCVFGGTNLDRLFITSASVGLDSVARAVQPLAGGLFVAVPGARGLAGAEFAG